MRERLQLIPKAALDAVQRDTVSATVSTTDDCVTIHSRMSQNEFLTARRRIDVMLLRVATARARYEASRRP